MFLPSALVQVALPGVAGSEATRRRMSARLFSFILRSHEDLPTRTYPTNDQAVAPPTTPTAPASMASKSHSGPARRPSLFLTSASPPDRLAPRRNPSDTRSIGIARANPNTAPTPVPANISPCAIAPASTIYTAHDLTIVTTPNPKRRPNTNEYRSLPAHAHSRGTCQQDDGAPSVTIPHLSLNHRRTTTTKHNNPTPLPPGSAPTTPNAAPTQVAPTTQPVKNTNGPDANHRTASAAPRDRGVTTIVIEFTPQGDRSPRHPITAANTRSALYSHS